MIMNDPIVEEMRKHGSEFAARHNHDISKMCKALKSKEQKLNRKVINRPARCTEQRAAS
jgi:hypothetical protein